MKAEAKALYLYEKAPKPLAKKPSNDAAVRAIAARNPNNTPEALNAFFGS